MARKKIYENKVSEIPHRIKLFESTQLFVAQQQKLTGKKQVEIIRELCHSAHQDELARGQFSIGTTNIFQSVQGKLIKKNVNQPLERLTNEIEKLQHLIGDMNINTRFASEEVFKVLRTLFVENQILAKILYKLTRDVQVDLEVERRRIKEKYVTRFETRQDDFFTKYQRLTDELTTLSESGSNDSNISES